MLKIFKSRILAFIIGGIVIGGISTCAASSIMASSVKYKNTTVQDAIDDLYRKASNSSVGMTDELKELVRVSNRQLSIDDVINENFIASISSSKTAIKIILDNETFRNSINETLLNATNTALVQTVNNNNVIYSSQYDGNTWAAYKAFTSAWCNEKNDVSGAYIGYKFDDGKNVRIIKFNNGDPQTYPLKEARIQYSDDNLTWYDASDNYDFGNSNSVVYMFNTKNDAQHQYWRIYIVSAYKEYIEISNLQFFGV